MAADEREWNYTQPEVDLITSFGIDRNNAQNTHVGKDQGFCCGLWPITHLRITPSTLTAKGDLPLP